MDHESEPSDLDREVDASMRMFEKSQVGPAAAIIPRTPAKVLLVLDGSTQDATATSAANHLQGRFQTETLILDARDNIQGEPTDLALDRYNEIPGSTAVKRPDGDAYEAILAVLKTHDVDLVIVPCPFGRDFEKVGVDSAGTVMDVMLSRCPIAMLVIRRDDQYLAECIDDVSMVVGAECDVESRAAAWVFGIGASSARVTLNLVIEKEQYENIRSIIEAVQPDATLEPEQFIDALTKAHQSIHAAMAKTASENEMSYQLKPIAGEVAPPNPLHEKRKMLLVMPLEVDDRFGQGFVHDRIRRSPHPVLVVPGHVR